MRITIINHSDTKGGAAIASMRMLTALRQLHVDARMLVFHKYGDSPYVEEVKPEWRKKACFLAEHADIYLHNGLSREKLFQASTGKFGMPIHKHPWVKEADYMVLGWVNQGLLSLKEIAKIKAPVAWIMHDMWEMTGVCHHAGTCDKFTSHCDYCPLLKGNAEISKTAHDLSWRVWEEKRKLYAKKKILFVSVSNWLYGKARQSALLGNCNVTTIANPFPDDFCKDPNMIFAKKDGHTIVMGAARLDDSVKGLPMAIDALNILHDKGIDAKAVFYGDIRNPELLKQIKMPYEHLGVLSADQVRDLYSKCDAVLSSSHYETLPTTLIEGMAAGCVPVSFNQGGQTDIIDHLATGYIAKYPSAEDLATGLQWALSGAVDRAALPSIVKSRFGYKAIAEAFLAALSNM